MGGVEDKEVGKELEQLGVLLPPQPLFPGFGFRPQSLFAGLGFRPQPFFPGLGFRLELSHQGDSALQALCQVCGLHLRGWGFGFTLQRFGFAFGG